MAIANFLEWLLRLLRRPEPEPEPEPEPAAWDEALLAAHNRERKSPLVIDSRLQKAARLHAEDMAKRDKLSHSGTGGTGPGDRARKAGYSGSRIGENIAWGQASVQAAMNSWIYSTGHYQNIVDPRYRHVGFGYVKDARGRWFWCVVFGG